MRTAIVSFVSKHKSRLYSTTIRLINKQPLFPKNFQPHRTDDEHVFGLDSLPFIHCCSHINACNCIHPLAQADLPPDFGQTTFYARPRRISERCSHHVASMPQSKQSRKLPVGLRAVTDAQRCVLHPCEGCVAVLACAWRVVFWLQAHAAHVPEVERSPQLSVVFGGVDAALGNRLHSFSRWCLQSVHACSRWV